MKFDALTTPWAEPLRGVEDRQCSVDKPGDLDGHPGTGGLLKFRQVTSADPVEGVDQILGLPAAQFEGGAPLLDLAGSAPMHDPDHRCHRDQKGNGARYSWSHLVASNSWNVPEKLRKPKKTAIFCQIPSVIL
jgi:hypothetical protein